MAGSLRTAGAGLLVALLAGLAGCSWGGREPGLFSTPDPSRPSLPAPVTSPEPTNPLLPVVADALWTTADGGGVTMRLAVHAVRRTAEATVLDWSVTPLAGPGRRPGEPVPSGTNLGLGRTLAAEQAITLLDVATGHATRPLANVSRAEFNRCLCTPLFAVTSQLRFGETKVLQLVFPRLPLGTFRVDVAFPNVAVVPGVPVTPVGGTPVADGPTDLARPAAPSGPVTAARTYVAPDPLHRQQTVVVDRVVATRGLTSVLWTLHSVDDQPARSVGIGPPVASPLPDGLLVETREPGERAAAAGARPPGSPRRGALDDGDLRRPAGVRVPLLRARALVARAALRRGFGAAGDARRPAAAWDLPGRRAVPGLSPFTAVPVTWVDDVAGSVQTVEPGTDETWTYTDDDPPRGWSTSQWPTPLPAGAQVADYASAPERILDALPTS